jgi:hypothetical protein
MKYVNDYTGKEFLLNDLTPEESAFYRRALEYFHSGMAWLSFDEFAFGPSSPIYKGKKKPQEVVKHPLFLVLKDMSVELGISQGKIKRSPEIMRAEPARQGVAAIAAAVGRRPRGR